MKRHRLDQRLIQAPYNSKHLSAESDDARAIGWRVNGMPRLPEDRHHLLRSPIAEPTSHSGLQSRLHRADRFRQSRRPRR